MHAPALRPRSSSELLDAAFQIVRTRFGPLTVLAAVAALPSVLGYAWLIVGISTNPAEAMSLPTALSALAVNLLASVWWMIVSGALIVAVSDAYLGRRVSPGVAIERALSRAGTIAGAMLAKWILIYIGFIVLLVPGVYLMLRYFAVPETVLLEDGGVGRALDRSAELSKGRKGKILKTLALAWAILIGVYIAFYTAIALGATVVPRLAATVGLVVTLGMAVLLQPLWYAITTLLYYDMRVRHEAFDLSLMAEELEKQG
ncbi:MAG: glycerophosphoryl diester phosphodiesterase membrane domain-containing protein [Gemmatimonadaceae bacterium]